MIMGVSNGAAVIIGMAIGENNIEKAHARAKAIRRLGTVMGIISCIFILLVRDTFVGFYNVPEETKILASQIITAFAFITICCAVNMVHILGILRGAGDTKFCMATEISCLWLLSIPLASIGAFVFQLPVVLVFMLMKIDEPSKMIVCLIRTKSDKWMKSLTRNFE